MCPCEGLCCFPFSHYLHIASAAASCNPRRYHPEKQSKINMNFKWSHKRIAAKKRGKSNRSCDHNHNNVVGGTYWDVSVQWFSVSLHVRLSDVQHVHLRAGHHDTDEGLVLGPCSLSTHHNVTRHWLQQFSCVPRPRRQCRKQFVVIRIKCNDKQPMYRHGLVEPFCKVGRGVPDAFH